MFLLSLHWILRWLHLNKAFGIFNLKAEKKVTGFFQGLGLGVII
jgi:hypothetical protein